MAKGGASCAGQPAASLMEISRVLEETARLVREHAEVRLHRDQKAVSAREVRAIIAARWLRREHLGAEANDAEWAMMLELYAARLEGRRVYPTMLGVAAAVPHSTALRITRKLIDRGTFVQKTDKADRRLLVVMLSDEVAERLAAFLATTRGIVHAA